MRTSKTTKTKSLAGALWPAARRNVLGLLLADSSREWHLREIARRTGMSPAAVHSEVQSLVEVDILERRIEAGRVYYRANSTCPIFPELRSIILKTVGLVDVLRNALANVSGIEVAFIYGSLTRGEETAQSDVDLMVIGKATLRTLSGPLHSAEETLTREVNPTTYSTAEFRSKLAEGHHFLTSVLRESKLFVIGDANVLDRLAKVGVGDESQPKPSRNRRPTQPS